MTAKPADTNEENLDTFWLTSLYPDASATFDFAQKPLAEVKDACIVVLDANVLLLPYRLGATSLVEIKKLFNQLSQADRVFLPAQAVREFLKHRANRIRDVLRDLGNQASQIQVVADRKIGFLESDPGYQELIDLSQKIKELKGSSLKTISQIGDRLRNGIGFDPVSAAYREAFAGRVVELDGTISDNDLKKEMAWRYRHSIPPGYKDRNKADDGIGDFLIWKTILQLGASRKVDCIFVTEDAKSDWWVQSEGVFQPRLELVEEYRRASDGKTLHLLPLSGLLETLGAESEAVDEARQVEIARQQRLTEIAENARRRLFIDQARQRSEAHVGLLDRNALSSEMAKLTQEAHSTVREKMAIDQTLRNPEALSSLSDTEVADLFRRRDEIETIRRTNSRERRRIDEIMRNHFLGSEDA